MSWAMAGIATSACARNPAASSTALTGLLQRRSGDRLGRGRRSGRRLLLEAQQDVFGGVHVDRDFAAMHELAEKELVGERAADRILDQARHGARAHERVEAFLREV